MDSEEGRHTFLFFLSNCRLQGAEYAGLKGGWLLGLTDNLQLLVLRSFQQNKEREVTPSREVLYSNPRVEYDIGFTHLTENINGHCDTIIL